MNTRIALALALAAAPLAAPASELSYNFIEAGYQRTDIDDLGEGDGVALNASLALGEHLHLFGGYARQGEETTIVDPGAGELQLDVDANWYRVGLGYNYGFSDRVDLVVRGAYERVHLDVSANNGISSARGDGKADGWSAEAGVRGLLAERLEGWAFAGYADVSTADIRGESIDTDEEEDDQAYGRVGAQFKFNTSWGLVGEARISDEFNQYFLGLRASF